MLSRIVQLTEEAQLSKPKLQRWLDKFGEQYSKAVVLLSLAVAFLGPFLFKWPFISTAGTFRSLNLSRYFFVCIYVLLSTSVFLALLQTFLSGRRDLKCICFWGVKWVKTTLLNFVCTLGLGSLWRHLCNCLPTIKSKTFSWFLMQVKRRNVHMYVSFSSSILCTIWLSGDFFPSFSAACRGSVYRALGLMVAASPCALAVAPLAYATAISACAKRVAFRIGRQSIYWTCGVKSFSLAF